jgi:hypothetical protein
MKIAKLFLQISVLNAAVSAIREIDEIAQAKASVGDLTGEEFEGQWTILFLSWGEKNGNYSNVIALWF